MTGLRNAGRLALLLGVLLLPSEVLAQDAETEEREEAEPPAEPEAESEAEAEPEPEPEALPEVEPEPQVDPEPEEAAIWDEPLPERSQVSDYNGHDPCATDLRSRPIGPLQIVDLDGMLGVPHRVCPREELAIGGDFLLVADTANFYGNLRFNGRVRVSAPVFHPDIEAFVSWEAVRYHTIISAISAEFIGLGYLSWGVSGQLMNEDGLALALTSRFVAPTSTGLDQGNFPLALDVGLTLAYQAGPNFRFHAWTILLGSVGTGGLAEPRGGLRAGAGIDWRPADVVSIVLEAHGGFFYRDLLDLFAAQLGLRFALGDEVGLELSGSLPIFGVRAFDSDAFPIMATLMLSWHRL